MFFASSNEMWPLLIDQWMHEASHYKYYWSIWSWNFLSNLEYLTVADVTFILVMMLIGIAAAVWFIYACKVKDDYLDGFHDGLYSSISKTAKMRAETSDVIVVIVSDSEYRRTIDQVVYARYGKSREALHQEPPKENECHTGTFYTEYTPFWYRWLRSVWRFLRGASASVSRGFVSAYSTMTKQRPTTGPSSPKKEQMDSLSSGETEDN